MDIGKRIRALREERGLTQREVARRARLTPSGVGFIEHGQTRNPSAETVVAIARALGVSVAELLREPVPLDGPLEEAGPTAQVVVGGGIQSSAVDGGFIFRHPTEEEWAEFVRELEDLQHDIDTGEISKGVAWDTVVGTIDGFRLRG
jgi:transcriptional regulator with XRE-family HTH domain